MKIHNASVSKTEVSVNQKPLFEAPKDLKNTNPEWESHRRDADQIERIYLKSADFEPLAEKIHLCSTYLGFSKIKEKGGVSLKVRRASFCRQRFCPICIWRKSLKWHSKFFAGWEKIEKEHPKVRLLFLTLTVKNCSVQDLKETTKAMHHAWSKLVKRKEFAQVNGWLRALEITHNPIDGTAHPHFHCLLVVPESYFNGRNYVTQARWSDLWKSCGGFKYQPIVDIRTVANAASGAVEVLKYCVKPSDIKKAGAGWLIEMTKQLKNVRNVAAGGILKKVFADLVAEKFSLIDEIEKKEVSLGRVDYKYNYYTKSYKKHLEEFSL